MFLIGWWIRRPRGFTGPGHFAMGPVAMDVFSSPSDPAFWLHHANVDRLWAMWQGQDRKGGRVGMVWGTGTSYDSFFLFFLLISSLFSFFFLGLRVVLRVDGLLMFLPMSSASEPKRHAGITHQLWRRRRAQDAGGCGIVC